MIEFGDHFCADKVPWLPKTVLVGCSVLYVPLLGGKEEGHEGQEGKILAEGPRGL